MRIEFGIVVDTTIPDSIIEEACQKCRRGKDLARRALGVALAGFVLTHPQAETGFSGTLPAAIFPEAVNQSIARGYDDRSADPILPTFPGLASPRATETPQTGIGGALAR